MDYLERAEELKRSYKNIVDITNKLIEEGYNKDNVPQITFYERVRKALQRSSKKKNIVYEDKKEPPTYDDVMNYYEKLKELNQTIDTLDTKQTKTSITIDDDLPIGIAFQGDIHIGARGVDYEQFDKDRELIKETVGLYLVGTGDYKENQNTYIHGAGVNEQTATPGLQDLLVKSFFIELKDKFLAAVRGCHDDWDYKTSNKDFMAELCEVADCVNLWHGGGITINLGNQEYKLRVRHKYTGESNINTTNTQRRLLEAFGPADVIVTAHRHYPDLQMLDRMEQKVVYLRSGSYKIYDEFGQKIGGYKGKIGVPVVVLFPKEKRVVPFQELRDGITYLKAVRQSKMEAVI